MFNTKEKTTTIGGTTIVSTAGLITIQPEIRYYLGDIFNGIYIGGDLDFHSVPSNVRIVGGAVSSNNFIFGIGASGGYTLALGDMFGLNFRGGVGYITGEVGAIRFNAGVGGVIKF